MHDSLLEVEESRVIANNLRLATVIRVYLEIAVTRFMQPMPILTPASTKSFLELKLLLC